MNIQLSGSINDIRDLLFTGAGDIAINAAIIEKSLTPPAPLIAPIDICRPRMIKESEVVVLPEYGLMFTTLTLGKASSWSDAKVMADACRTLGHTDWRLPEVEELQLLIRRDRSKPAIDAEYFPDTKFDDWYWTNTPLASSPSGYAWYVLFYYGYVYYDFQDDAGFVRAVRSVAASQ